LHLYQPIHQEDTRLVGEAVKVLLHPSSTAHCQLSPRSPISAHSRSRLFVSHRRLCSLRPCLLSRPAQILRSPQATLTLLLPHHHHSESHNTTQNIDHARCSKQPSHRDYPDNLSHHSVPTSNQPTQLPSPPQPLSFSLPGKPDFKHSFTL